MWTGYDSRTSTITLNLLKAKPGSNWNIDPKSTETLSLQPGEAAMQIVVTSNCFIVANYLQPGTFVATTRIYDLGPECRLTRNVYVQDVATNIAPFGQQVLTSTTPSGKWTASITGPLQPGGGSVADRRYIQAFNAPSGRLTNDDTWSGIIYTAPSGRYLRDVAASDEGPIPVVFFLTTEDRYGNARAYLSGISTGPDGVFNTGDETIFDEAEVGTRVGTLMYSSHLKAIWTPASDGGRWIVSWVSSEGSAPPLYGYSLGAYHYCT